MKINPNDPDVEELELQNFIKFKSKKQKLKSRQSIRQLTGVDESDGGALFNNPDLNALSKMGHLDELLSAIRMGKEASVFLGRNENGLVAVKMYTDLRVRSFRRDEMYREGRFIGDARIEKAIEQGSEKGLDAHQILWVQEEFRQMKHLEEHGVRVPHAITVSGITLIMEFIGAEDGEPAPRISDLKMQKEDAHEAFRQSLENLKRIVASGRVHGDYSTFNILWHAETAVVIDFPQVMEIGHNHNARTFLERDVRSLCRSFARQGVQTDENAVIRDILS